MGPEETEHVNPFQTWADMLQELRNQIVAEMNLGTDRKPSAHLGEILGSIMGLATQCAKLAHRIDYLERADPEAWAAVRKAMENPK